VVTGWQLNIRVSLLTAPASHLTVIKVNNKTNTTTYFSAESDTSTNQFSETGNQLRQHTVVDVLHTLPHKHTTSFTTAINISSEPPHASVIIVRKTLRWEVTYYFFQVAVNSSPTQLVRVRVRNIIRASKVELRARVRLALGTSWL